MTQSREQTHTDRQREVVAEGANNEERGRDEDDELPFYQQIVRQKGQREEEGRSQNSFHSFTISAPTLRFMLL
jgi:hypothetical protein